jgi:uncharacterized protein
MWIDLHQVRERGGSLQLQREFADRDLDLDPQTAFLKSPARISAKIVLHKNQVRVTGRLQARLHLVCSRCLGTLPLEIDKEVNLEYSPDPLIEQDGEEIGLEYSDLEVGFYRGDRISLSDLVNEQLLLEVPMKTVCREDCRGLCPLCGCNRNEVSCDCSVEQIDPRLAALTALKQKMT